jgi:hypothetical protein
VSHLSHEAVTDASPVVMVLKGISNHSLFALLNALRCSKSLLLIAAYSPCITATLVSFFISLCLIDLEVDLEYTKLLPERAGIIVLNKVIFMEFKQIKGAT